MIKCNNSFISKPPSGIGEARGKVKIIPEISCGPMVTGLVLSARIMVIVHQHRLICSD